MAMSTMTAMSAPPPFPRTASAAAGGTKPEEKEHNSPNVRQPIRAGHVCQKMTELLEEA